MPICCVTAPKPTVANEGEVRKTIQWNQSYVRPSQHVSFTAERYRLSVPHWVSFSLITLVELHRSNPVDLVLRLSLLHSQSTFLVLDIQWLKAHQTSNSNHCNVSVQKGGCFLHREGHLRSSRNVVAFGVAISWEHPHV